MRIDGLSGPPRVSQAQQREESSRARKGGARPGDVVEISRSAQDVSELSELARSTPPEPNRRVDEIKARVKSGYYDSRDVREQIADSLLQSGGMRQVVDDIAQVSVARQQLREIPDTRQDRVDVARQRMGTGFYDTADVRRETADRVLDELA